jgi:hypothetical protein
MLFIAIVLFKLYLFNLIGISQEKLIKNILIYFSCDIFKSVTMEPLLVVDFRNNKKKKKDHSI